MGKSLQLPVNSEVGSDGESTCCVQLIGSKVMVRWDGW